MISNLLQPLMQNQGELAAIELLNAKSVTRIEEIIKKHKAMQDALMGQQRDHETQVAEQPVHQCEKELANNNQDESV